MTVYALISAGNEPIGTADVADKPVPDILEVAGKLYVSVNDVVGCLEGYKEAVVVKADLQPIGP